MSLLEIKNLQVKVDGNEILKGVNLTLNAGEVHSIMGPNGSGKSTLAQVLARRDTYEVTGGEVLLNGKDLLAMKPEEAACEGLFLAFQYPVEIPGISNAYFLRSALNAIRKYRGQEEMDAMDFLPKLREKIKLLDMDEKFLNRSVNESFSGGEKKRNEILQMEMLEPSLAILDETDSGLDIDALRIVAKGVNAMRSPERAMLVVTHYQRLLDYIVPDHVHVLVDGRIVRSGGPELALELETKATQQSNPRRRCMIARGKLLSFRAESRVLAFRAVSARAGRSEESALGFQGNSKVATATQALQHYLEGFASLEKTAPSRQHPWLRKLRQDAFARFAETGFPTTRDEDWRFTNLATIAQTPFRLVHNGHHLPSRSDIAPYHVPGAACQLVFVDGRFAPELSSFGHLPDRVTIANLAAQIERRPAVLEPHLGRYLDTSATPSPP